MKTTNENFNGSEGYLIDLFEAEGIKWRAGLIKDFRLDGTESTKEVQSYFNDYLNELHSEVCYAKANIKNGYDQY